MDVGIIGELESLLYKVLEGIYYGADTKSDRKEYVEMIYGFCKQYIDDNKCREYATRTISTLFDAHIDGDGDKICDAITDAIIQFKKIYGDKYEAFTRNSSNEVCNGD